MALTGVRNWLARLYEEPIANEIREGRFTFDQYEACNYVAEMMRRHEYYRGIQVVQAAGNEGTDDPDAWNQLFSGSGWQDLTAMLPQVMEESTVHPTTLNFTKLIIDNTQVVFAYPPKTVELHKNGTIDEQGTETMNKVYDSSKVWLKADEFCKLVGLCNLAFQFIGFDEEAQRLKIRNLPSYLVYVIPDVDRPGDLQAENCLVAIRVVDDRFITASPNAVRHIWQVWWKNMWWFEDGSGRPYKDPQLKQPGTNPNPYFVEMTIRDPETGERNSVIRPVKPILYMTTQIDEVCDQIYMPDSDQLTLINQRIDRDLTGHGYTGEFQSFAIGFFSGLRPEEIEKMAWSPGSVMHSENKDASLTFAHPLAPLGEHLNTLIKKLRMFARAHHVDPELVDPDSKVESGVSKAQARFALQERREQEFPRWQPYVRELYWLCSLVWNKHQDVDREMVEIPRFAIPFKDEFEINIEFGEMSPVSDPLADEMTLERWVNANFGTREEVIAAQRRIRSPKRAAELAKSIRETNEKERLDSEQKKLEMQSKVRSSMMELGGGGPPDSGASSGAAKDRIGQPGNRPVIPANEKTDATRASSTGGNTTAASGNKPIGK